MIIVMAGSANTFSLEGTLLIVGSMLEMINSCPRAKLVSRMLVQAIVGITCFFSCRFIYLFSLVVSLLVDL